MRGRLDTNAGALLVRIPSEAQDLCSLLGTGPDFFPKKKVSRSNGFCTHGHYTCRTWDVRLMVDDGWNAHSHSPALPLVLSSSSWPHLDPTGVSCTNPSDCCRPAWLGNRFSIPLAGAAVKHHKEVFTRNLNYATSDCILVFGGIDPSPRHPQSSKHLVSKCLEPLKTFSDVWGFKHRSSQGICMSRAGIGYMIHTKKHEINTPPKTIIGKLWYPWDGTLIYTLYSGYLSGIFPFKGLLEGLNS